VEENGVSSFPKWLLVVENVVSTAVKVIVDHVEELILDLPLHPGGCG